jgi:hypothetical protein
MKDRGDLSLKVVLKSYLINSLVKISLISKGTKWRGGKLQFTLRLYTDSDLVWRGNALLLSP